MPLSSQSLSYDLHFRALPSSDRVESMSNKHIFSLREVIQYRMQTDSSADRSAIDTNFQWNDDG